MSTLDKRLQILIDEPRLRRVASAAAEDGVSVGEWVRNLIDERLAPKDQATKIKRFLEFLETIERIDIGDSVEALRDAREARIDHLIQISKGGSVDDRGA